MKTLVDLVAVKILDSLVDCCDSPHRRNCHHKEARQANLRMIRELLAWCRIEEPKDAHV